jgi:GNAT superfamily N-acetyltransferase
MSDRVMVRPARPADADAAVAVVRRSITESCRADHQGDPTTLQQWLANKTARQFGGWLDDEDNYCVVAALDGPVCGVGLVHRNGEVMLCYVSPEAQHRGVGRAVYAALEAKARAWGLASLHLSSTLGARRFYENLGYRQAGEPRPGFGLTQCHPYEKSLR